MDNGTFIFHSTVTTSEAVDNLAVVDINRDNRIDLFATYVKKKNIHFFLNNGNGTFDRRIHHVTNHEPIAAAIGDFNKDEKFDIVLVDYYKYTVEIFFNIGDGILQVQ